MDWLISDTHFGHKNIIKFCNRPENHDEIMIENWNKLVGPKDTIMHLGDVFMGSGSKAFAKKIFKELPGEKMLIRGNHDHESDSFYESLGFKMLAPLVTWGKSQKTIITHYPYCRDYSKWQINIHGHIHNNGYAPGTPPKRIYCNISVEVTGYSPVPLESVLIGDPTCFQSRKDGGNWPLSLVIDMNRRGRLDKHFCEIEQLDKIPHM